MRYLILLLIGMNIPAQPAMANHANIKILETDSIHVLPEYRQYFIKALESVFGVKAKYFSYTKTGNLVFNGNVKALSKQEHFLYRRLKVVMEAKTVTSIIYKKEHIVKVKGHSIPINTKSYGGEGALLIQRNPLFRQNYIIIDPDAIEPIVVQIPTSNYYEIKKGSGEISGTNFRAESNVIVNPMIATWHGLAHVIYAGQEASNVINLDNLARTLFKKEIAKDSFETSPLPPRRYDQYHNHTVTWSDEEDKWWEKRTTQQPLP